jgi:hypothetical protein
MDVQSLFMILGAMLVIGVCVYMLMELRARTLRTRVIDAPGTLRFEAHTFWVEVKLSAKQIKVHVDKGRLTRHPLQGGPDEVKDGPLDATLPAPGLNIAVMRSESTPGDGQTRPQATGLYSIILRASDATTNAAKKLPGGYETVLEVTQIPEPVAKSFESFSNRVQIWADKLEHRLKLDLAEQVQKEEDTARAAQEALAQAEGAAAGGVEANLELANDQVARWRKAAGFRGVHSEVSIDDNGRVHWFIDLADDGRITLHANNRTIHTTLLGASFLPDKLDLEVQLRDDYWSEDDRVLSSFRIFDGLPPDGRRLWKERLETARNKLDKSANLGEGHQR